MMKINDWMLINLSKPTIIGKIQGHPELPDGYEVQVEFMDINVDSRVLISPNNHYKLGEVCGVWWRYKKGELGL